MNVVLHFCKIMMIYHLTQNMYLIHPRHDIQQNQYLYLTICEIKYIKYNFQSFQ